MKKILLCSAALIGVSAVAAPAMAQVDVTVGGYTKNYMGWLDQDDAAGADTRHVDMLRDSELHFNAEGTADNGLTYGFHAELLADGGDDANTVQESYLYLSSNLGRINLGSEDGANYLLQVAAPSADANIDGLRQYISPIHYASTTLAGTGFATLIGADGLDYDNDATGDDEKVTYLSPNWSGFQFGLSYTPDVADNGAEDINSGTNFTGFSTDNVEDNLDSGYEAAVRYEGTFNNIGFAVGAGYTLVGVEEDAVGNNSDDWNQWNVGADFDIGAFGLGAAYTQDKNLAGNDGVDVKTYVVGGDYTTGPFQFGVSYLRKNANDINGAGVDVDTDRYAGGVVYTLTQGLTLRGSIDFVSSDVDAGPDVDATSVLGGIQFNF